MNSTGCTVPGMATDQVFRADEPMACDVPVAAFCIIGSFICLLNAIRAVRLYRQWRTRHSGTTTQRPKSRRKMNIPWACVGTTLFVVDEIVFVILSALNLINFGNGWSVALFTAAYLCFSWNFTYGLFRLVSLGEKILPKEQRGTSHGKRLSTFDFLGKTMVFVQLFALVSTSLVLIVLGPIFPQHEKVFLQVGFACKAMYFTMSGTSYVYHFQRCITIIKAIQADLKGVRITGSQHSLNSVIRRMRWNQGFHITLIIPSVLVMLLLAADVFPANVWVVIVPGLCESVGQFVYDSFISKKKGKDKGSQRRSSEDKKPQIDDQAEFNRNKPQGQGALNNKAEAIVPIQVAELDHLSDASHSKSGGVAPM